jgi:hypothetical protein
MGRIGSGYPVAGFLLETLNLLAIPTNVENLNLGHKYKPQLLTVGNW